jgi:hypothetical protein
MRPRFSLRWLLIFTALIATTCYAWVVWPTSHAQRFVEDLNRFEPEAWTTFFDVTARKRPNVPRLVLKDQRSTKEIVELAFAGNVTAFLLPKTRQDLLRGQRRIALRGPIQHIGVDQIMSPSPTEYILMDRLGSITELLRVEPAQNTTGGWRGMYNEIK